ncbi:TerB N-terminal domain-containing protein [Mycobacterium cookii]
MGLFERWLKQKPRPKPSQGRSSGSLFDLAPPEVTAVAPSEAPRSAAVGQVAGRPNSVTASAPNASSGGVQQLSRTAQWIGPGASTNIGGQLIPGGMLYVGRGLRAATGSGVEPALIDPTLTVRGSRPDHSGATMSYWPTYADINPQARAAYLSWLAGGRRDPNAYIGYVFLFFYGLERRALVDIPRDSSLLWEVPHLRAEVQRLLDLHRSNSSFCGYASRFLDVLDLQGSQGGSGNSKPPALDLTRRYEPPIALAVEVGSFAADRKPVPADWALAWAWYHPEIHLRTPATRCREEFATLFKARYTKSHQDGITVRPTKKQIGVEYYAASAGIRSASLSMKIPDVFTAAVPTRQLAKIVDSVTEDLDPYSRYLGRNPDGRHSLGAAALLPEDLAGDPGPEVAQLRDWAHQLADAGEVTAGSDLMSRWPTKSPDRMAKNESVTLAQLLGRHGYGIEPDVRLGGPAITPATPVVVFRIGAQPPQAATPSYAAAATLVHLATAVSAADGHVSSAEQDHLVAHLENALELTAGERARLEAHTRWLVANGVKLTGLKKRVEVLTVPQRQAIGDLLVAVAAADGAISPEEITSLTKIYQLLDLDTAEVHTRLHAHLTGARPAPATGPVTVRPGGKPDPGYPITPPSATGGMHARTDSEADGVEGGVRLDLASIEAKFAETAAVSALLADIFSDDGREPRPVPTSAGAGAGVVNEKSAPPATEPALTADSVAGLDASHSALVRTLVTQDTWGRAEFEELAATWQLMPDGALDRINEAALDAVDELLLEDDDSDAFTVNDYARQELLR